MKESHREVNGVFWKEMFMKESHREVNGLFWKEMS